MNRNGISVVVASYRRPERLAACLEGLRLQTHPADEIVVVVHAADPATAACVAQIAGDTPIVTSVVSDGDGSVAAYNTGLLAARYPLVAYVDDDAVPEADWLEGITRIFASDPSIAAVGGRDVIFEGGEKLTLHRRFGGVVSGRSVGRIQWFGRMISNHHVGAGPARDVDVLKGVNMAFRRRDVVDHGFDERLKGTGAVVHSELSICLPLRKRGLRIVYDPGVVVRHYPAVRPAGDDRKAFDPMITAAAAHNEALQILDYFSPRRRWVFAVWGLLIGTTHAPGMAVTARDVIRRRPLALARLVATQRGRAAAWRTCRRPRSVVLGGGHDRRTGAFPDTPNEMLREAAR